MSAVAPVPASSHRVRVLVAIGDRALAARWRAIVHAGGHHIVESADESDVLLADETSHPPVDAVITITHVRSGGVGRLRAAATDAQIDAAIRAVAAGLLVRSPQAAGPGFGALDDHPPETLLTPREIEVLDCMSDGLTNKLIARRLDVSLHTVKFHVESVLRKLGVTTRTRAVALMLERRRAQERVF